MAKPIHLFVGLPGGLQRLRGSVKRRIPSRIRRTLFAESVPIFSPSWALSTVKTWETLNPTINHDPPQPFTLECWANSTGLDAGTLIHSMIAGDNPTNS